MSSISATSRIPIWGTADAWSIWPLSAEDPHQTCVVQLTIEGDEQSGYHLIMSPQGFFTADTWHPTQQDALDTAAELFHVESDQWSQD